LPIPKCYTPAYGIGDRPVLVFIHGGSFDSGSGGITAGGPDYDGADIARRSGAVVVTINYRLSLLANAGLDKDNGRPSGNYRLQDQQQALAAIATDSFFSCPTENVRGLVSGYAPVWAYEFNKAAPALNFPLPPAPGLALGDSHTTELAYVFGHDGAAKPLAGADAVLSNRVIAYWTSLAAAGSPNHDNDRFAPIIGPLPGREDRTVWPRFAGAGGPVLSLASPLAVEENFAAKHQCALWLSLGYPEVLIPLANSASLGKSGSS
jgi:para-nitrobenzyl esterase